MSELDLFGMEETNGEQAQNASELELDFAFDYPNVLNNGKNNNLRLCASVKPSDEIRRQFDQEGTGHSTHICLVIDRSFSMFNVVDYTGFVRSGKTVVGEDGKTYNLGSGGLTKLDIAIRSAKKIVDMLRPGDTIACVSYADSAKIEFENYTSEDGNLICRGLDRINEKGMNTNISAALLLAKDVLSKYNDAMPKRVLFFTDGEPTGGDTEEKGIAAGNTLAKANIAVECMGFGKDDVNFPYLQRISSASGGITSLISYPDEFAAVFSSLFAQSQSVIITNVKLVLKRVAGCTIRDYYRGTPDNVYLGDATNSNDKILELNLGQIEKNQMYKYYFNLLVPGQVGDYLGPVNTLIAELHYFVPGKYSDKEQIIKKNVTLNVTSDEELAQSINGDVSVLFRLAEVKRFDDERERAFNAGDSDATIKWIKKIIDVYTELQKPVETKAYTEMLEQYMKTYSISKAVLNKATSSSSQAQETGILEDLGDEEMSQFASRLKNRRRH